MKRKNKGLGGFYEENKTLVWVGGFSLGVAIIYGIYRATSKGGAANVGKQNISSASMNASNAQTQTVVYVNAPATGTSTGASVSSSNFPLKIGSNNEAVRRFQIALNTIFGTTLVADGAFGQKTDKAWYDFVSPITPISEADYNAVIQASQQQLGFRKRKLKETFINVNATGDVQKTFNEQNPIKLGF